MYDRNTSESSQSISEMLAPNVQLRYNSTIIQEIHYQTHSDPYTKKDHCFDMFIKSIHLKARGCHIYLILIEILQILRTC